MEFQASLKYMVLSPKKTWRITRELRGFSYKKAMETLREVQAKPARILEKLLRSCFYNALNKDSNLSEEDLTIKEIHVGQGPVLKRMSPRAQGRADVIAKPTAHIRVVLEKKEK
jgi:large subunit ribosomal protein L22